MTDSAPLTRTITILNPKGLHARASARFVACIAQFKACVVVSRDGNSVDGTSIMGLLMLGASYGTEIEIEASGPEAADALEALTVLVRDNFLDT